MRKKIIIAMSGGIDSSVVAALIKERGMEAIGIFMRLYPNSLRGSEKKAQKVAEVLGIPFYVLNLEKEFKKKVIDYFLKEYKKGRTPNPCVVCNKEIKFGLLLKQAKKMGGDFLATGHYVRKSKIKNQKSKVTYKLLRGIDREKDQSYFLWQLDQNRLKHILFPLGDYTKKEVRNLANGFKLSISESSESQEICFIKDTCNDFLAQHIKQKPGPIVEQVHDGVKKIIGEHNGLWFYTVGQRKGIKLPGGPFYVLDKNLKKNLLIVSKNKKDLEKKELIAENVNWISGNKPKLPLEIKAKIRYRHKLASATIYRKIRDTKYKILFKRPQRSITPGQSVVFYQGAELLGGGIVT